MSNDYSNIFNQFTGGKSLGGDFLPKVPPGRHTVVLETFRAKTNKKDQTTFLDADFYLGGSTVAQGESRGWAWFTGKPGFFGQYEGERARQFMASVAKCVGIPLPHLEVVLADRATAEQKAEHQKSMAEIGGSLIQGKYRGLQLNMSVTQEFETDGKTPKRGNAGQELFKSMFEAIPGQTDAIIAQTRASLDSVRPGSAAPAVAATAPVAAPAPTAPTSAPATGGLLSNLRFGQ